MLADTILEIDINVYYHHVNCPGSHILPSTPSCQLSALPSLSSIPSLIGAASQLQSTPSKAMSHHPPQESGLHPCANVAVMDFLPVSEPTTTSAPFLDNTHKTPVLSTIIKNNVNDTAFYLYTASNASSV